MIRRQKLKALLLLSAAMTVTGLARPAAAQAIDNTVTVELAGNTRPEANLANDRGILPQNFALQHMQLLLKRAPATEAALESFIDSLHDETSPNFHQWLTAAAFGEQFGPAESDIASVIAWLQSHGFTVNGVSAGRTMIDFSGTAAQVQQAFHTEMHRLSVRGASHIANMSNPRIPQALAGVVEGVVSLNDFLPRPLYKPRPAYTASNGYYLVAPADLAKIYNFTPEFAADVSGQGQTVVVIEDTNIYSAADWTTFRKVFGLNAYTSGKLTQTHPAGKAACANPGVSDYAVGEAELDMEWASAAAPSATIEVASCADSTTTFGGLLALQNLVNSKAPPAIVSISYGECEAVNGATQNAAYNSTYQQAVALGISVFVAAGDSGAAGCDPDLIGYNQPAKYGVSVSGFASTPYNVAVGGTDFGDTYAGTNATYWTSGNTKTYGSAKSYVPEIPWNDTCASVLISLTFGYSTPYGSSGFCNSSEGANFQALGGGSGGPSGCATGKPAVAGVVGGTCKGYAKPAWQSVLNNPADKVRDLPDVALFAANGLWSHYYPFCFSDTAAGGVACTGAPVNWSGAGGTSFASPIMAGVEALINQVHGKQGNPNPTLYKLASAEYGTKGDALCYSTKGKGVSAACTFYDVTLGDMDSACTGTHSCYTPSGSVGVLSTSDSAYKPAYKSGIGWDFATGIGTINVKNLVTNW
jgi:subtilase family serine protease